MGAASSFGGRLRQRYTTATVGSTSPAKVQGVDLWQLALAPGMLGDGGLLALREDVGKHWAALVFGMRRFAGLVACPRALVAPFTTSQRNGSMDVASTVCALFFVLTDDLLPNSFRSARVDDKVVEALMCIFPDKVRKKRVSYSGVPTEGLEKIPGDTTCRYSSDKDWATLVDHHCIVKEDAGGRGKVCSCPKYL